MEKDEAGAKADGWSPPGVRDDLRREMPPERVGVTRIEAVWDSLRAGPAEEGEFAWPRTGCECACSDCHRVP